MGSEVPVFPCLEMSITQSCVILGFHLCHLMSVMVSLCHFNLLFMVVGLKLFPYVQWSLVFLIKIACPSSFIGVFHLFFFLLFLLICKYFIILITVNLCLYKNCLYLPYFTDFFFQSFFSFFFSLDNFYWSIFKPTDLFLCPLDSKPIHWIISFKIVIFFC